MSKTAYLSPAVTTALTGSSQVIHTGACVFMGLSIMDEAAGSIKVQVYDGVDDTGVHLLQLNINSGGNDHDWFGPNGIACTTGIYVKVYSGTPVGAVFHR